MYQHFNCPRNYPASWGHFSSDTPALQITLTVSQNVSLGFGVSRFVPPHIVCCGPDPPKSRCTNLPGNQCGHRENLLEPLPGFQYVNPDLAHVGQMKIGQWTRHTKQTFDRKDLPTSKIPRGSIPDFTCRSQMCGHGQSWDWMRCVCCIGSLGLRGYFESLPKLLGLFFGNWFES